MNKNSVKWKRSQNTCMQCGHYMPRKGVCKCQTMKTNIDLIDNPNSDNRIQKQLVTRSIRLHEALIQQWKTSPKRDTRAVQKMIREYTARLNVLKAHENLL